jgi:hypothetical protein
MLDNKMYLLLPLLLVLTIYLVTMPKYRLTCNSCHRSITWTVENIVLVGEQLVGPLCPCGNTAWTRKPDDEHSAARDYFLQRAQDA